jgi:hypothetical protein
MFKVFGNLPLFSLSFSINDNTHFEKCSCYTRKDDRSFVQVQVHFWNQYYIQFITSMLELSNSSFKCYSVHILDIKEVNCVYDYNEHCALFSNVTYLNCQNLSKILNLGQLILNQGQGRE